MELEGKCARPLFLVEQDDAIDARVSTVDFLVALNLLWIYVTASANVSHLNQLTIFFKKTQVFNFFAGSRGLKAETSISPFRTFPIHASLIAFHFFLPPIKFKVTSRWAPSKFPHQTVQCEINDKWNRPGNHYLWKTRRLPNNRKISFLSVFNFH